MAVATTLRRLDAELGELLERHERGRSLDEFAAYRDDPIAFIREVLHGEPWSRQVEIAEAVRDEPALRPPHRSGLGWCVSHRLMGGYRAMEH